MSARSIVLDAEELARLVGNAPATVERLRASLEAHFGEIPPLITIRATDDALERRREAVRTLHTKALAAFDAAQAAEEAARLSKRAADDLVFWLDAILERFPELAEGILAREKTDAT